MHRQGKIIGDCSFQKDCPMLSIGTLARRTGTKVRTMRYYKEIGH